MIYVVTNRKLILHDNLFGCIEKALDYGTKNIILREKDLSYEELYKVASKMKDITDRYEANLIVNGNLRVAEEIKAYAYQSRFIDFIQKGGSKIIKNGVSIHSIEEAKRAEENGADYILVGNIYETECKKGLKGKGTEFLRHIAREITIPEIAIGGISEKNIVEVMNSGAKGAAIMSSAMKDPAVVKRLIKKII
ncbi:thiamine phosphate synthase [Clostridium felsineum]|uniref:thiamine phosphate synthase n=1 Tax=Clostridium felsineum TaxID=36839 RepID=UPI00098C9E44|nr:thiamine phosphate synthase [Clostridium felsineum]URZ14980.1 Thiamine-phosphate synthase [Clostridium felsineum DSM 794]